MSEHDTLHYCLRLADLRLVPNVSVVIVFVALLVVEFGCRVVKTKIRT